MDTEYRRQGCQKFPKDSLSPQFIVVAKIEAALPLPLFPELTDGFKNILIKR